MEIARLVKHMVKIAKNVITKLRNAISALSKYQEWMFKHAN